MGWFWLLVERERAERGFFVIGRERKRRDLATKGEMDVRKGKRERARHL